MTDMLLFITSLASLSFISLNRAEFMPFTIDAVIHDPNTILSCLGPTFLFCLPDNKLRGVWTMDGMAEGLGEGQPEVSGVGLAVRIIEGSFDSVVSVCFGIGRGSYGSSIYTWNELSMDCWTVSYRVVLAERELEGIYKGFKFNLLPSSLIFVMVLYFVECLEVGIVIPLALY